MGANIRHLKSLEDLSRDEILSILDCAAAMKKDKSKSSDLLKGKSIGLVFQKPSNRTRVSFEVGINQMGGNCIYLGPGEINLGVRESTSDVAKTLSRYLDGIVARTFSHRDIIELSEQATVPTINGLCDLYHPCQGLTDLFSIREAKSNQDGIKVVYIGDGNNVCHSLLLGCAKVGMNLFVATPDCYEPDPKVVEKAKGFAQENNSQIVVTKDVSEAVKDADVIYSDVWVSMGQEEEMDKRITDFHAYQINKDLVAQAKDDYVFMHCLPAHRGQEVTGDVIDGEHSIVFDQAENRMHTQKAILHFLFKT